MNFEHMSIIMVVNPVESVKSQPYPPDVSPRKESNANAIQKLLVLVLISTGHLVREIGMAALS
jgi:hypothetical protein